MPVSRRLLRSTNCKQSRPTGQTCHHFISRSSPDYGRGVEAGVEKEEGGREKREGFRNGKGGEVE